jgi:hypothetical protein
VLNVPLKESCVVFIVWKHIIVVFSFDALFWVDLAHAHTMFDYKPVAQASMIIWFFICDITLCFS